MTKKKTDIGQEDGVKSPDKNSEKENQQFLDQLLIAQERERRALADYQNMLRRVEGERARLIRFANQELFEELLPVLNNLQEAAKQIQNQGLTLVVSQLKKVLIKYGVEEIEALGKKFDLDTMEAIDRQGDGDIVIQVLQRGYKLKDKVLIHAKVILGTKDQVQK